ncbi:hypothetical protein LCGC14_0377690 [marine sediment metagenome]|uniref:Uncharacterized protein n=1 Tax=marine sediment metagenome TaxID=412755 RepID=A0A0F9TL64_9ZZZZ
MKDKMSNAAEYVRSFGDAAQNLINAVPDIFDKTNDTAANSQKPEPDFLCACNGKACDGVCRAESGHFRGGGGQTQGGQTQGGCTAAYRPPKPKAVRHIR